MFFVLDSSAQSAWWLPITDTGEITYYGDSRLPSMEHSLVRETLAITYPENEYRRIEAEFNQAKEDYARSQGIYVQDIDYVREVQHEADSYAPDFTIAPAEQPQRHSCNREEHLALVCDHVVADIAQLKSTDICQRALGILNLYSANYLLPYEQSQEYQKLLHKFQTCFDPVTGALLTCEYDFHMSQKVQSFVTACNPNKLEQVCELLGDYSGRKILEDLKRPALQRVVDGIGASIEKIITMPAQLFGADSYVHTIKHNQGNKDLKQVIQLCAQNQFDQAQKIRTKYRACAAHIAKLMDTVYAHEYQRYQQEYDEFGINRAYAHAPWWRDMPAAEKQALVEEGGTTVLNEQLRERQERFAAVCRRYKFTQQEQCDYRDGIYTYADCTVSCLAVEKIFEERAAAHAAMAERWRESLSSEKQQEKIERMRKWIAAYEEVLEEQTAGSIRYSTIKHALEPVVINCLSRAQSACAVFEQCYGNALQQRMHEDYVAAVETIATAVDRCTGITTLAQVAHNALELAGIGCELNKIALVDRAADVLEVCHQALNWACVVPESIALATGRFTSFCGNTLLDPVGTANNLWEVNKELLAVLAQEYWYGAAYKELAELDYEATQRWAERHESTLLNTLESAYSNITQMPARDVVKEELAFAAEWVLTKKLATITSKQCLILSKNISDEAAMFRLSEKYKALLDGINDPHFGQIAFADGVVTDVALSEAIQEVAIAETIVAAQEAVQPASAVMTNMIAAITVRANRNDKNPNDLFDQNAMQLLEEIKEQLSNFSPATDEEIAQMVSEVLSKIELKISNNVQLAPEEIARIESIIQQMPKVKDINAFHILDGNIDSTGKGMTGCHHALRNPEKIIGVMGLPDQNGVFKLRFRMPSGGKSKASTCFPLDWTERDIICKVLPDVLKNLSKIEQLDSGFAIEGRFGGRIKILGFITNDGVISSFYSPLHR